MTTHVHNLPDDLFSNLNADVNLFFYTARQSSQHNKIVFSHNLLCLLVEGEKTVISPNYNLYIDKDSFFMLAAGNNLMSEKLVNNNLYRSILFFFSNSFVSDFVATYRVHLVQPPKNSMLLAFKKDAYLWSYEQSLLLSETMLLQNTPLTNVKLTELLLYLLDKHPLATKSFIYNILHNYKNNNITDIVHQHLHSNLTIEELAFLCNMSISTFKRKFAEAYHTTPKQFFIAKKMEQAAMLLQQHKKPSEFYDVLGYENLSAFSHEFKKYFGVSPKHYLPQL